VAPSGFVKMEALELGGRDLTAQPSDQVNVRFAREGQ
jgi:hypothetical protein